MVSFKSCACPPPLFRSEAYNFIKTFAWYFLYPTLVIVVVDRFLCWATAAVAVASPKSSTRSWSR